MPVSLVIHVWRNQDIITLECNGKHLLSSFSCTVIFIVVSVLIMAKDAMRSVFRFFHYSILLTKFQSTCTGILGSSFHPPQVRQPDCCVVCLMATFYPSFSFTLFFCDFSIQSILIAMSDLHKIDFHENLVQKAFFRIMVTYFGNVCFLFIQRDMMMKIFPSGLQKRSTKGF